MSDKSEALLRRIRKTLELAKRGEGGEKETAERMLEAMLRKAGLTMADIDDETEDLIEVEFACADKYERTLLRQIVGTVLNTKTTNFLTYRHKRTKRAREAMLHSMTKAEKVEVELHYEMLKPALRKVLDDAVSALIHVQRLFPAGPFEEDNVEDPTPEERARAMRVGAMASFMDKTEVRKVLEAPK